MKLILTEYINSLKEDGELDKLIQEILKAYGVGIITKPDRGRQYGVDIFAVGKDFEDNGKRKVFLITVKQGDLDRQNWNADQNSVYQSLEEIRTVFIRNNLPKQYKKLPIKIVVAFNGTLKQGVQQNWHGYEDANPDYEFVLWQQSWLLERFEEKLLNEQAFSNDIRSLIRKTIIHLENPDYEFADFTNLLELVSQEFKVTRSKKSRLKLLKELQVIVAIILKYCDEADNLLHAVKVAEKYVLMLWSELIPGEPDKEYTICFIGCHQMLLDAYLSYYHKLGGIGYISDGFSRRAGNALLYSNTLYTQLGIFAMTGLVSLQMSEIVGQTNSDAGKTVGQHFKAKAEEVATTIIHTINNNKVFYSPSTDDQHIEICLIFVLLQKLGHTEEIGNLLYMLNQQMGEGLLFLNVFPDLSNSRRQMAELHADYEKRMEYKYRGSNLLTVLAEWSVVIQHPQNYRLFRELKEKLLKDLELLLWFPEKETEDILYHKYATSESGYTLSNIKLPDEMSEYQTSMLEEYFHNCHEKEFSFMKSSIWSIGLLASRHYRTYIFPHYWRQFLPPYQPTNESEA